MKSKLVSNQLVRLACYLLRPLIAALACTYRFQEEGLPNLQTAKQANANQAFLLACWHETVLALSLAQRGRAFCSVCSRSNAGTVVAYLMRKMGFYAVQGSQSGGGKEVRNESLDFLKRGIPVAITVDGSKGPRRVVKPGIIDLAARSATVILPASVHINRFWTLNTWDKFRIPKPFARITIAYGEPISVPPATAGQGFTDKLEIVTEAINAGETYAGICASKLHDRVLITPQGI